MVKNRGMFTDAMDGTTPNDAAKGMRITVVAVVLTSAPALISARPSTNTFSCLNGENQCHWCRPRVRRATGRYLAKGRRETSGNAVE